MVLQGQGPGQVQRVTGQNNIFVAINLFLFVLDTSNLSHIVAYKKGKKILSSKVKVKVKFKVKVKGKKVEIGSNCRRDFELVSYCIL